MIESNYEKKYDTDLTDEQWAEIATLFVGMRKYKWEKRELLDAVFYLVDSGCILIFRHSTQLLSSCKIDFGTKFIYSTIIMWVIEKLLSLKLKNTWDWK